jgi:hypothetical protein
LTVVGVRIPGRRYSTELIMAKLQRPSGFAGRRSYAMMPPHAPAIGVPGHHQRVRTPAAAARRRPGQGRRDPRPPPPARGATAPTRRAAGPVQADRSSLAGRAAAPPPETPRRTACGYWCGPTPSCAGIVTSPPAVTRRHRDPGDGAGHAPSVRFARWCCAWSGRTRHGATGGSTGNCSPSGSRSPRQPSGRSCARPGSTPPRTGPPQPGASPALAGRRAAGGGLHRDHHAGRHEDVRPRDHRTRQPPHPHPRRDRAPDRCMHG